MDGRIEFSTRWPGQNPKRRAWPGSRFNQRYLKPKLRQPSENQCVGDEFDLDLTPVRQMSPQTWKRVRCESDPCVTEQAGNLIQQTPSHCQGAAMVLHGSRNQPGNGYKGENCEGNIGGHGCPWVLAIALLRKPFKCLLSVEYETGSGATTARLHFQ